MVRQKSEPINFPGLRIVLVALVQPEDIVACIDSMPSDSLQLSEKVKQVSGLVNNECRA